MWDKTKAFFKNSLTILWARVQMVIGLLGALVITLLQDPNITGALQAALQPKYIPFYVIAIGLLTELARRRSLDKSE